MNAFKKDNVPDYYVCEYLSFLLTIIIIFTIFTLTIIVVKYIVIIYPGCK